MSAMSELHADAENVRAAIGGNNPPEPTPFEAIKANIDDLYVEAKNWCDGAKVETQAQADEVGRLLDMIRKAHAAADEARKAEAKPFDDGKAEVQARYNPLIADTKGVRGKTVLATEACKAALAPFLQAQEAQRRAEAERLRQEAEAKAKAAAEAARAASQSADLDAMEAAEMLVQDARAADRQASRVENDKAQASGGARAVTLRSYFTPVLDNPSQALMHYAKTNPQAVREFLWGLAVADVRAGKRDIPGFRIDEERRPV